LEPYFNTVGSPLVLRPRLRAALCVLVLKLFMAVEG